MTECQICFLIAAPFDDPSIEEVALRAEGWTIFSGRTWTGEIHTMRLCPQCGEKKPQARKPQVLEGQDGFDFN